MGLGILLLASYGKENLITTEKPKITFFKKVYKKYNNFSFETIPQFFKSTPNFGRKVTVNVSKVGDMINNVSLFVELPEIPFSNHTILPEGVKKFAWVNKLGFALIKFIDIEIGGILVNRLYNDWINIYFENNYLIDDMANLIGYNIEVINDFSNGKPSFKLHIPIKFFFNIENEFSLPILSITKQDVKIHLEFNDFNLCYQQSPTNYFEIDSYNCLYEEGEFLKQNVDGNISIGEFVYFDVNTKRVYYNKKINEFFIPTNLNNNKYKIIGENSLYESIPKINSIIVIDENYFFTNFPNFKDAYILVTYVFLENNEKWYFQNNKLEYIIPLVQNVLEQTGTNINKNLKLNLTNPHKLLFWRCQFNFNRQINDHYNYTTYPLTKNKEPIILENKLMINSIPRIETYNYEYYNFLQPLLNNHFLCEGVNQYSFCLNPKKTEANGTINFSKIDDAFIQFIFNKNVSYQNTINIKAYGVYYNILVIKNGSCSLKFSN